MNYFPGPKRFLLKIFVYLYLHFKLDSGSDVNLLTLNDFNFIKNNCSVEHLLVNKQSINLQTYLRWQ